MYVGISRRLARGVGVAALGFALIAGTSACGSDDKDDSAKTSGPAPTATGGPAPGGTPATTGGGATTPSATAPGSGTTGGGTTGGGTGSATTGGGGTTGGATKTPASSGGGTTGGSKGGGSTGGGGGTGVNATLEGVLEYLAPGKYIVDDQQFFVAQDTKIFGGAAICSKNPPSIDDDGTGYGPTPCTEEQLEKAAKEAVQSAIFAKVVIKNGIAVTIKEKVSP